MSFSMFFNLILVLLATFSLSLQLALKLSGRSPVRLGRGVPALAGLYELCAQARRHELGSSG